jgi:uncharacterized protein YabN with tetrapyrrole methylase and pyrophosphatase domain
MIIRQAGQRGIAIDVLPAMSFMDELYAVLKVDPVQGIQIIDGLQLEGRLLNPALGIVVMQVYSRLVATDIKLSLLEAYPAEHQVAIVRAAGVPGLQRIEYVPVVEITSYEQLKELSRGDKVAIMNSMEMCLAEITEINDEYVFVYDGVQPIMVNPNSFKYGNFMYKVL